jgi:hypothetical protein
MEEASKVFFGHLIRQTTTFRPDVEALKAAQTRTVVGVGATSKGQLAHRTGLALAEKLGVDPVVFPGDHSSFLGQPGEFAQALQEVLRSRRRCRSKPPPSASLAGGVAQVVADAEQPLIRRYTSTDRFVRLPLYRIDLGPVVAAVPQPLRLPSR